MSTRVWMSFLIVLAWINLAVSAEEAAAEVKDK